MGLLVLGGLGRVACIGSMQGQHIEGGLGPALTMQHVPFRYSLNSSRGMSTNAIRTEHTTLESEGSDKFCTTLHGHSDSSMQARQCQEQGTWISRTTLWPPYAKATVPRAFQTPNKPLGSV